MSQNSQYLTIGLGNPGIKYLDTRHNVGHKALDTIHKTLKQSYSFSSWAFQKKLSSQISQGSLGKIKIILSKPIVFMNESGGVVKKLLKYYGVAPAQLIILHDEFDLPIGQFKISFDRGSAGHKGINSIIKTLKTKAFIRIRIGIRPRDKTSADAESFVLKNFSRNDKAVLKEIFPEIAVAIQLIIEENVEKAMALYN